MTGESKAIYRKKGDNVLAMTVIITGKIFIEVSKKHEETVAFEITRILNKTVDTKSQMQIKSEVLSHNLIFPTALFSVASLPFFGITRSAAILNSIPADMGATVTAIGIMNYLNESSQYGILIKDGRTLDLIGKIDCIVFDKTGTLTHNNPVINKIHSFGIMEENQLLCYAASAESKQTHPIALSIINEAKNRRIDALEAREIKYFIGYGISCEINNNSFLIGSLNFMKKNSIFIPPELGIEEITKNNANTFVFISLNNKLSGVIEIHPTLRPESKKLIKKLNERGLSLYLISGDQEKSTREIASTLGIKNYFSETLPSGKSEIIKRLQSNGHRVCYIGDGINDSLAMKVSNVSISLKGASTVATDTAQIVLMNENLLSIDYLFDISSSYEEKMRVVFKCIYTFPLLGIAGVVFFKFGSLFALIMNNIGYISGLYNTILPIKKDKKIE